MRILLGFIFLLPVSIFAKPYVSHYNLQFKNKAKGYSFQLTGSIVAEDRGQFKTIAQFKNLMGKAIEVEHRVWLASDSNAFRNEFRVDHSAIVSSSCLVLPTTGSCRDSQQGEGAYTLEVETAPSENEETIPGPRDLVKMTLSFGDATRTDGKFEILRNAVFQTWLAQSENTVIYSDSKTLSKLQAEVGSDSLGNLAHLFSGASSLEEVAITSKNNTRSRLQIDLTQSVSKVLSRSYEMETTIVSPPVPPPALPSSATFSAFLGNPFGKGEPKEIKVGGIMAFGSDGSGSEHKFAHDPATSDDVNVFWNQTILSDNSFLNSQVRTNTIKMISKGSSREIVLRSSAGTRALVELGKSSFEFEWSLERLTID